jgi:hypothetical protein
MTQINIVLESVPRGSDAFVPQRLAIGEVRRVRRGLSDAS